MDWLTVINTSVGLMSLCLGGLAIWLSLHFYTKAKDAEIETAKSLAAIRAQSDTLQRLTGKWMDRFTRHATEPRPADQGLMQLVHVVASLPTTILAHLHHGGAQPQPPQSQEPVRELVDSYVGLYYYTALSNVLAQSMLPAENVFNSEDPLHVGVRSLVDRTAADFAHMAQVLAGVNQTWLDSSPLKQLLDEALRLWTPEVRYASQVYENRQSESNEGPA